MRLLQVRSDLPIGLPNLHLWRRTGPLAIAQIPSHNENVARLVVGVTMNGVAAKTSLIARNAPAVRVICATRSNVVALAQAIAVTAVATAVVPVAVSATVLDNLQHLHLNLQEKPKPSQRRHRLVQQAMLHQNRHRLESLVRSLARTYGLSLIPTSSISRTHKHNRISTNYLTT